MGLGHFEAGARPISANLSFITEWISRVAAASSGPWREPWDQQAVRDYSPVRGNSRFSLAMDVAPLGLSPAISASWSTHG